MAALIAVSLDWSLLKLCGNLKKVNKNNISLRKENIYSSPIF